jgi:hypothetical protein
MESTTTRQVVRKYSTDSDDESWIPLTPPKDPQLENVDHQDKDTCVKSRSLNSDDSDPQQPTSPPRSKDWFQYLALFGDSSCALAFSGALLVVAVMISVSLDGHDGLFPGQPEHQTFESVPDITPAYIFHFDPSITSNADGRWLSEEMLESFERDGVIAVRGIIDPEMLDALDQEATAILDEQKQRDRLKAQERPKVLTGRPPSPKQFLTVKLNAIFPNVNQTNTTTAFATVAMMSNIPKFAANLLHFDDSATCTNQTVRILRDIFLAKDEEEYICGWHVDDVGFWPALAEAPGVNAWIALDDMPVDRGGGFALAVGSHTASWREEAYNVTGSTHTFPKGGFKSSIDILQNRPGNGTCNIKDTAPHLHRRMEETKRVYEIKRGDVIFHHRWLFHRTIPFSREVVQERISNNDSPLVYRRYSIRYGPGSSIIPPGYGTEPSVISDFNNGGRTADEVALLDAPWYPKVWPSVNDEELEQMKILARQRLPEATEKSEQRKKVIRPRKNRQH